VGEGIEVLRGDSGLVRKMVSMEKMRVQRKGYGKMLAAK